MLSNNSHAYGELNKNNMNMLNGYALHEIIYDSIGNPVNFRYVCVNPAFEKLTGLSSSQIIGRTVSEVMPQSSQDKIEHFFQAALSGAKLQYEDYSQQVDRYFDVKVWSPSASLLSCLFTDVTEKKRLGIELRSNGYSKQLFLRIDTDGLFILDSEGYFLEVNQGLCLMCDYSSWELQGGHLSSLQAGGAEAVGARLKKIKREGRVRFETRYHRKNGREIDVEVSAQHFPDADGQFVMIVRDVSGRKNIVQQAVHAAHLATVGELSAGMAHEINNPINGMINCAQLLISRKAVEEKNIPILARIVREGNRVAEIVRSLLFFSRDSRNEKERTEINKLLGDILILTGDQLYKDKVDLQLNLAEEPLVVEVNSQKIEQVILNLISNSRYALNERDQAAPIEKVLSITVEAPKEVSRPICRLIVRDNGTGIAPDILKKLGTPFVTTKPAGVGTGLGLSISREIIRSFDGELTIASQEGEFTQVTIELPIF